MGKIGHKQCMFAAVTALTIALTADCYVRIKYRSISGSLPEQESVQPEVQSVESVQARTRTEPVVKYVYRYIERERRPEKFKGSSMSAAVESSIEDEEALVPEIDSDMTPADLCTRLKSAIESGDAFAAAYIREQVMKRGNDAVSALQDLIKGSDIKVAGEAHRILCGINTMEGSIAAVNALISSSSDEMLSEFSRNISSVRDKTVASMLAREMGLAEDEASKMVLSEIVTGMEGDGVVESLANLMSEASSDREAVEYASAIAGLKKTSNTAALENILSESSDPLLRHAAVEGIANIGNRDALDILVVYADEDRENRNAYSEAIARVSSPYGQSTLVEIVKNHPDADIRASASAALANYRSSDVKRELQKIYHEESDESVKEAISHSVNVIEQITRKPAVTEVPDGGFVEAS